MPKKHYRSRKLLNFRIYFQNSITDIKTRTIHTPKNYQRKKLSWVIKSGLQHFQHEKANIRWKEASILKREYKVKYFQIFKLNIFLKHINTQHIHINISVSAHLYLQLNLNKFLHSFFIISQRITRHNLHLLRTYIPKHFIYIFYEMQNFYGQFIYFRWRYNSVFFSSIPPVDDGVCYTLKLA